MSKDKKIEQEQKQEKTEQEIQTEAKRIADMEAKIISLENDNKAFKEAAEQVVAQCNKKIAEIEASYQDAYKGQMLLKEKQAQDQIKLKLNEIEAKAKAELLEAKKYAIKDQAIELIDIIAEFEKACSATPSDPKIANWLFGFKMFITKFDNLLADMHIQKIIPEVGKEFDPHTSECFSETVSDPTKPDGTVVSVIYPGYKLYDRLLRPALVKVVKNN